MAEAKEVELGDGSETDIECNPAESEENLAGSPAKGLFRKALQADVPVIVSLHFLVLNVILSIALGALLFKFTPPAEAEADAHLAPGELLYSESLSSVDISGRAISY